ncbi:MAG: UDP-glucose 4-epimerase GalE [Thiohalocapsa sp.]|jgi:UDP-glucose 4-epimerase
MRVLVTGGAGYIGTHTCVELLDAGHDVVVIDNLSNSKPESLRRVEAITRRSLPLVEADLRDRDALDGLLRAQRFEAVIHFAGLKAVGESTRAPLDYYENNVAGTLTLCRAMASAGVRTLVFSSSATVYGDPATVPIREDFPLSATNPYGRTKLFIEEILRDLQRADADWDIALLRYFNPVGAHPSGLIGEDPNGIPNNLMPFIAQVAIGKRPQLQVFGSDYDTPDGTGVRDYIHVVDLARGHLAALERLTSSPGVVTYNLGTGRGYSVLEMVRAFEKASGRPVPYRVVARRPGDIGVCYADPQLAQAELGWRAEHGIDEMVGDTWRWQSRNPDGYR